MKKNDRKDRPGNSTLVLRDVDSRSAYLVFRETAYRELAEILPVVRNSGLKAVEEVWLPESSDRREGRGRLALRLDSDALIQYLSGSDGTASDGEEILDVREIENDFISDLPESSSITSVPTAAGLRMPAEWEPHAGCLMAWPCREGLWGDDMERARDAFAFLARTISVFEPVTMLARPEHAVHAAGLCGSHVTIMPLDIDDSWTRDTGPTFVAGPEGIAGVDWIFNGYGNIYTDHLLDNIMARAVLERLNIRRYAAPLVMEGSAFHVDGEGTLIATEECLLNPNRNPRLSRREIEGYLIDYLGISTIIWLGPGLEDDESSGHVSNVACFSRPGQVLVLTSRDPSDSNYWIAQDNIARLRGAVDARGRTLEIVEIEQPAPRFGPHGRRLPLSYVNFYMPNDAVIIPGFNDPADTPARLTLERIFPERRVIQIPALNIVRGGGGIHCVTQHQPAGKKLPPFHE